MTNNTDGAAQGEWQSKQEASGPYTPIEYWEHPVHGRLDIWDIGPRLNELERKAQMADVLAKALDNMLRWEADVDMEIPNDELLPFYLGHAKDWNLLLDAGRAALAQFHAVTEEATR